jgi:hypothetical protein
MRGDALRLRSVTGGMHFVYAQSPEDEGEIFFASPRPLPLPAGAGAPSSPSFKGRFFIFSLKKPIFSFRNLSLRHPKGDARKLANAALTQSPAEGNPPAALSHRVPASPRQPKREI